jgi:hypothetical protein
MNFAGKKTNDKTKQAELLTWLRIEMLSLVELCLLDPFDETTSKIYKAEQQFMANTK